MRQFPVENLQQGGDIVVKMAVAHDDGVLPRERSQILRQIRRRRHARTRDQNRNNLQTVLQSRPNFPLYEILAFATPKPAFADDHQQHAAFGDGLIDGFDEIMPRLYIVDIHEDPSIAEDLGETVEQAPGKSGAVLATIVYEDGVSGVFHIRTPGIISGKYSGPGQG
jgi:hypothetical protein